MASCKTFDQKPLVSSRRLSMESMHDVIGMRFSSLFNSDLTWKNVAKGNRSASRRARSSVSRCWNAGVLVKRKDSNAQDLPFSESEKLGVSILGCHFSENPDYVPIKKRKLSFRSKSPPSRAQNKQPQNCRPEAACKSETGHFADSEVIEGSEKTLGRVSKQFSDKEDFSGIFILAAAACSDSFGEGSDSGKEGSAVENSCVYEDSSLKNKLHCSSNIVVPGDLSSAERSTQRTSSGMKKVKEIDGVHGVSCQDDRSFWDLNTSMDAWSCPVDHQYADSNMVDDIPTDVKSGNCSDKIGVSESETTQDEPEGILCRTETRLPPVDPGGIGHKEQVSNTKECKSDSWTDIDRNSCLQGYNEIVSTESVTMSTERDKHASAQFTGNSTSLSLHQVTGLNSFVDDSLPSKSNQTLRTCISKAVCDAASTSSPGVTFAKNEDGCAASICKTVSSSLQVDEAELASHVSLSVNTICYTQDALNEDAQVAKENSVCQSIEGGALPCSTTSVQMSTVGVLARESKLQSNNAIQQDESEVYQNNSKDVVSCHDKVVAKEPSDNGCNSDVSHDHDYAKARRCEVDYDSQYEDGELRESVEHPWQEYGGDDLEVEQVDYGSDSDNLGPQSEKVVTCIQGDLQTHSSWLKGKDAQGIAKTGDNLDSSSKVSTEMDITNSRIGNVKDDRIVGHKNYFFRKNFNSEDANQLDSLDRTRVRETRTFRRDMCSRFEERKLYDDSFRKDRGRYTRHYYAGAQEVDRLVDSRDGSRDIKHYNFSKYNGSMSFHHNRHLKRSRSPDTRNEAVAMQMRCRSSRNLSPGWRMTLGRGRSVRYGLQVDGRGPKSDYYGIVADDCNDLSMTPHPVTRRERSFSPIKRRELHAHRSHSRSTSRSRSLSSSSGNPGFRYRSKSPNFRSSLRMQRTRSPCPGPLVGRLGGFNLAPKGHNERWTGDKKDDFYFREQGFNKHSSFPARRSRGRFVQEDRGFDLVNSSRTFRSTHPRRFMEMGGAVRGGLRHEESDDDRGNHRYIYGKTFPVKRPRYNVGDGYNSRYRDDVSDFCGSRSPKSRVLDSQIGELPRKFREVRGQFRYEREGKYNNVDRKSFGVLEAGDEMMPSRRSS